MTKLITGAILSALILATQPAAAQSDAEAAAIEDVIRSQIDAFLADDWERAFTYASPNIQSLFETSRKFGRMVRTGYPMVWRPGEVTVGELAKTSGGLKQTMFFEDRQGRLFIADYAMVMVEGEWRINGVRIRKAPEQAV